MQTQAMPKKPKWITFTASPDVKRALDTHRKRLEKERGVRVTVSDAARDAILRAGASTGVVE